MNVLLKTLIVCLCLFHLQTDAQFLEKWYFIKNEQVEALKSPQVVCKGVHCNEVDVFVVKCEGVFSDSRNVYSCYSADILPKHNLIANYTIECKDEIREKEHCFVNVHLERFLNNPSTLSASLDLSNPSTLSATLGIRNPTENFETNYWKLAGALLIGLLITQVVVMPIAAIIFRKVVLP